MAWAAWSLGTGGYLTRRGRDRSLSVFTAIMSSAPGHPPPAISVLMVAYNAGTYLVPAVESILAQTCAALELVLVDDASTDGSVAGLRERVSDQRLKIHRMAENLGQVCGWRAGLGFCRGEWLALLDADDLARPRRLERQRDFLATNPGIDVVTTFADEIDAGGRLTGPGFSLWEERDIRAYAEFDMPVRVNTAMMRRTFAEKVGFAGAGSWTGDYEFLVRALERGRVACLPEVLNLYRVHAAAQTSFGRNRQVLSAALVRFRAARRVRGLPESDGADAERAALEGAPGLRAVHRACMRRALAERLPALSIFHARRARSLWGVVRGVAEAGRWDRPRLGLLLRLALWGPVRALGVRTMRDMGGGRPEANVAR